MTIILDASAMVALLDAEPGGDIVKAALLEDEARAYAHVLNVTEVFYDYHRSYGEPGAQAALTNLIASGINIVSDMSPELWQSAARLKSIWRRVSLADCFGVALSQQLNGEFLTADRHELEALDNNGVAFFTFIR